jgi:hypothetical protein
MKKVLSVLMPVQPRVFIFSAIAASCAFALLLFVPAPWAQPSISIRFTIVADTSTAIPGGPGTNFINFLRAPSIDDDGNVAFIGWDNTGLEGIYTWDGTNHNKVADTNTPVPGIGGTFASFRTLAAGQSGAYGKASIDKGNVAFLATTNLPPAQPPDKGIFFTNADGALELVALGDDAVGNFGHTTLSVPWLDSEKVAYLGRETLSGGVAGDVKINTFDTGTNTTTTVIKSSDIPSDTLDAFHQPSLGGGGITVETSIGNKDLAIISGGSLDTVIEVATLNQTGRAWIGGTAVPGKTGVQFRNFGHMPVLDANGGIVFFGQGTDSLDGIYKRVGGSLDVVADTNTLIPGGGGATFASFGTQVATADGSVVFLGFNSAGGGGLYMDVGGTLTKIIELNDIITIDGADYSPRNLFFGSEGFAKTPTGYSAVFYTGAGPNPIIFRADVRTDVDTDTAMDVPIGQNLWSYNPVTSTSVSTDPADAIPVAVGSVATGGKLLSIAVELGQFGGEVDVYFGFSSDDVLGPGNILILDPDGVTFRPFPEGFVPYMANTTGPVSITLFGDVPISALRPGTYTIYLVVTPAGDASLNNFYLWITSFTIP